MKLKTIQQWLPLIGSGSFLVWTGFLVLLSLVTSPEEQASAVSAHPFQPRSPTQGCVAMPDLVICDELPSAREETP